MLAVGRTNPSSSIFSLSLLFVKLGGVNYLETDRNVIVRNALNAQFLFAYLRRGGLVGVMATNTVIQLVGQVIGMTSGIIVNAIIGRYLGTEGFGYIALAFSFVALFTGVLGDWGLTTIAVRRLASGKDRAENLLPGLAALQAIISILTYLLLAALLFALRQNHEATTAALVFGISILFLPIDSLACFFQARLLMRYTVTAVAVGKILSVLLVGGTAVLGGSVVAIMSASLAAVACQYVVTLFFVTRHISFEWNARWDRWKGVLREAWPLALATVLVALINQLPVIALSKLSTPGEVGLYAAASRIVMLLLSVPTAFASVVYPVLSRFYAVDGETFRKVGRITMELMLVVILPILMVVTLFANQIVVLLYGAEFEPTAKVLQILIWADVLLFPGIIAFHVLIASGLQRATFMIDGMALAMLSGVLYFTRGSQTAMWMAVAVWLCYVVVAGGALAVIAARFGGLVGWRLWIALASALLGPTLLIMSGWEIPGSVDYIVASVAIVSSLVLLSGVRAWKPLINIAWMPQGERQLPTG